MEKKYYENNVLASMNLAKFAVEKKIRKFIYSSSAAVYGIPIEIPIKENHPTKPINNYGKNKKIQQRKHSLVDACYIPNLNYYPRLMLLLYLMVNYYLLLKESKSKQISVQLKKDRINYLYSFF